MDEKQRSKLQDILADAGWPQHICLQDEVYDSIFDMRCQLAGKCEIEHPTEDVVVIVERENKIISA